MTASRPAPEVLLSPWSVTHRSRQPVFVVGHSRSGTTLVTKMIRQHLRIAFGTESQFITRRARQQSAFGDLENEQNFRRCLAAVAEERFFFRTRRNYGFELDQEDVVRSASPRSYAGMLDAIFRQMARHMRCERWGDKTPQYMLELPELHALFPDASYICVVRDGRDVALSLFDIPFGAKNVFCAAEEWKAGVEAVARFRGECPEARVIEIRYEDVLDQPAAVFADLIDFLEIDDPDHALRALVGEAVGREVRSGNSKKWKSKLTSGEQALFAAVAGDCLRSCGYECGDAAPYPGSVRRAWYRADNARRQLLVEGHWRDNLYKLGLRLGPLGGGLRKLGTGSRRLSARKG